MILFSKANDTTTSESTDLQIKKNYVLVGIELKLAEKIEAMKSLNHLGAQKIKPQPLA